MNRFEAEIILKEKFNYPHFYDDQWTAIDNLLKGNKVLLIQKTGFGKSLCFQFPAIIFKGTTVVFTPLISLMRDQVKKLNQLGISAKCIHSEQSRENNAQIINEVIKGNIKILYIAPERQENYEWIESVSQMNLSMLVVDEAHCVSVWGHDFRPAYRRIFELVKLLPIGTPVLATTATATKRVEFDILNQLGNNIHIIRGNLMRDNFKLFVVTVSSEDEKLIWLGMNLNKLPGSGIIYTGTRFNTEIYSNWLKYLNISSTSYNAGLDAKSRIEIETGFMNNKWKCIVSTNALGMGIDKPDIRFIIHTQIPQSPIHYYQEIGRAGRDGKTSYIYLFYNPEDRRLPESFIYSSKPPIDKYEKVISAVKNELLSKTDLIRRTNLNKTQIDVIIADLKDQGIIRELMIGKSKKYEFVLNSGPLNTQYFEDLRKAKLADLEYMINYVRTKKSRMKYLCEYLGDDSNHIFNNCDNTGEQKITVSVIPPWSDKLRSFREQYFPEIKVKTKHSNIVNGVAASYYSFSNIGAAIHHSKHESGGDFPDLLLELTIKAFYKCFGKDEFDLILYVPPTSSGDLVKNFAIKLSQALNIPIYHNLIKCKKTSEQKCFNNKLLKKENIRNAFTLIKPDEIKGKRILLFDDIYDSGETIKEIARLLTNFGAVKIAPLVIAKTVAGDIL